MLKDSIIKELVTGIGTFVYCCLDFSLQPIRYEKKTDRGNHSTNRITAKKA